MKIWLKRIGLLLLVASVFALLSLAGKSQEEKQINKPEIVIHVNGEHAFLTKDELYLRLRRKGFVFDGQKQAALQIAQIEEFISAMTEVKHVKVFTKLGNSWKIEIELRRPIARIFNAVNETFYLDEDGVVMKSSTLHTARVVVVTGHLADRINSISVPEIINNPTLKSSRKLDDVYRISNYVCNDPLLQSLIGQIHVKKDGDFLLIPLVGGHEIVFGSASSDQEVREKFKKLKIFYKEAIPYEGWDKYDIISLKYNKQIVCKTVDGYTEEKE
jgi:cell division protein FtsQ